MINIFTFILYVYLILDKNTPNGIKLLWLSGTALCLSLNLDVLKAW